MRCWPDPSDTVGRRDAFRCVVPVNNATTELPLARVPPLELDFGHGRRVEDSGVQTPNPCWQEPPRKVPRSSSRSLGVQEALSALLYQPYECRNDSSDDDSDEWPLDGGTGCCGSGCTAAGRLPSVSSAPLLRADASVASRMVSVSVEGGPAAGGLPAAADDVETEDEERRLCSMPHVSSVQIVPCGGGGSGGGEARTFTSTEAQTEPDNREQRRRERRERRQQRLLRNSAPAAAPAPTLAAPGGATTVEIPAERLLPDLLMNSYQQPPPYSTLPIRTIAGPPPPLLVPTTALATATPGSPPALVHQPLAMRFSFPISPTSRRCRGGSGRASHLSEEPKSCCGLALTQAASIRWFIVLIAFVGVCCAVVGTVLGAMRASGREHLTISLLMIGVGIVLVLVSGVGWRLTAHDAPSCRAMLGLGGHSARAAGLSDGDGAEPNRRFVPRLPPSYGRPHHPYAAMIYPEFQYRPPPPSYQASMQEYRLRLLLLDRGVSQPPPPTTSPMAAVSPPPTYRSNVGSMLRAPMIFRRDNNQSGLTGDASVCSSRPPSYRSRAGSTRPASVAAGVESNPAVGLTPTPSPTPPSPQPPSVSVICVGSPKILAPGAAPIEVDSEKASLHEEQGHLVTIVQTGHHEISSDPGVTTVTVSGLLASTSTDCGPRHLVFTPTSNEGEMEILAHL